MSEKEKKIITSMARQIDELQRECWKLQVENMKLREKEKEKVVIK